MLILSLPCEHLLSLCESNLPPSHKSPQLRAARDELMRLNAAAERVAVQQREEVPYCISTVCDVAVDVLCFLQCGIAVLCFDSASVLLFTRLYSNSALLECHYETIHVHVCTFVVCSRVEFFSRCCHTV
jgi:hypothetical protein